MCQHTVSETFTLIHILLSGFWILMHFWHCRFFPECQQLPEKCKCEYLSCSSADWSTCQLSPNAVCGSGVKTRMLDCVRSNGKSVNIKFCEEVRRAQNYGLFYSPHVAWCLNRVTHDIIYVRGRFRPTWNIQKYIFMARLLSTVERFYLSVMCLGSLELWPGGLRHSHAGI